MNRTIMALCALLLTLSAAAYRTEKLRIETNLLPEADSVVVIVPDAAKTEKCPTVYLLNGYTGSHNQWTFIRPNLGEYADLYGMILVMPHGQDTWYWDSPVNGNVKMESFITKELVPYIDSHYPTIPSRDKRAITGLSMGGHGALWLAGRHPDIFGSASAISGGVDIRPFPDNWRMKDWLGKESENQARWDAYTVATMVDKLKTGNLNIGIDCGSEDFFAKVNEKLHSDLLAAGVPHDYTSRPGAHTNKYWKNAVIYQLLFFNEAFNSK
ncbi:MAG: esterase family protein [Muribaculaceae bacterium]|nr:esterase family protein [Muribaculaceae bacterium]